VGAFSINPENSNGSIIGTTLQLGIPFINSKANDEEAKKDPEKEEPVNEGEEEKFKATREKFRVMLREGKLEDRPVELMVNQNPQFPMIEMMGSGMEELENSLSGIAGFFGGGKKKKSVTVARAREILEAEEAEKLVDRDR